MVAVSKRIRSGCRLAHHRLAEAIAPFAKHVVPHSVAARIGKPLASWSELLVFFCIPRSQHGVLDLAAQTLELQVGGHPWVEMILPPRVMLGKTANHTFQSLETMADGLFSVEKLKQVPDERVLVVDVADSAAPNRKEMHFTGQVFVGSKVYYYPQRCVIHLSVRGIIRMLSRLVVIKCLFCVTNVLSIANRQEALKIAIFVIVDAKLGLLRGRACSRTRNASRASAHLGAQAHLAAED